MNSTVESHTSGKDKLQACSSLKEILQQATEFERTARDFYADLSPRVSKQIRYLVDELAVEEQAHYDLFKDLADNPEVEAQINQKIMTPPDNKRFSDCIQLPDLGDNPDDQTILQYALGREQAAMDQYHSLAENTPEGSLKDVFTFLAQEETEHKNELEKLYYEVVHSGGV